MSELVSVFIGLLDSSLNNLIMNVATLSICISSLYVKIVS